MPAGITMSDWRTAETGAKRKATSCCTFLSCLASNEMSTNSTSPVRSHRFCRSFVGGWGMFMGYNVGISVGARVGDLVADVGGRVRDLVGGTVGRTVGLMVGVKELKSESLLGPNVGNAVGAAVSLHMHLAKRLHLPVLIPSRLNLSTQANSGCPK